MSPNSAAFCTRSVPVLNPFRTPLQSVLPARNMTKVSCTEIDYTDLSDVENYRIKNSIG